MHNPDIEMSDINKNIIFFLPDAIFVKRNYLATLQIAVHCNMLVPIAILLGSAFTAISSS